MKDSIDMKEIDESEIEDVFNLHNEHYQDDRTSEDWKHEYLGYMPDKSVFVILKAADRIVGTQGMIPINLIINNERLLTAKSENTLIDFKYRGVRLFKNFYDFSISCAKNKQLAIVWGLTDLGTVWQKLLSFNTYESIFSQRIGLLRLRGSGKAIDFFIEKKILGRYKRKIAKIGLIPILMGFKLLSSVKRWFYFLNAKSKEFIIKEKLQSENDLKELFQRLTSAHEGLIHIDQDTEYLSWRLYNNPTLDYCTYFIYQNDILRGYCYTAVNQKNIGVITDFAFENNKAGKVLLKRVLSDFKKNKVSFGLFFGNSKNNLVGKTIALIKGAGFLNLRTSTVFVLRNIDEVERESIYEIRNWHITGLWTEGYFY